MDVSSSPSYRVSISLYVQMGSLPKIVEGEVDYETTPPSKWTSLKALLPPITSPTARRI